ncbi:MAG: flagellar basal body P-ring formation chaperone FlgA [Aquabacterium sp.]|uniref:flagellar basal body P-ring formation chaperone FlgA n=1 Tax=Aquabacterium sp. TaxID=1872578 RepID=UPI002A36A9D9|nr:flagellar basal body P-ring formation chaperone FlgA [Aquabacterium sp.]MDX9844766.1 flagellar basal body P-ring formation chaperone FlgA [Aquabacterium sp.]
MSRNKRTFPAHFLPWGGAQTRTVVVTMSNFRHVLPLTQASRWCRAALRRVAAGVWRVMLMVALLGAGPVLAQAPGANASGLSSLVADLLQRQTQAQSPALQTSASGEAKSPRVEVVLGELDPRLKLAPCQKVNAYIPQGMRLWGKTRVGLRCEQGPVRWNVFWPVTVKVWGSALVVTSPVEPGQELGPQDVKLAEVDLAESSSPAVLSLSEAMGRSSQRRLQAGQSLRQSDLRARRWFSAGDPVRLRVKGVGFMAAAEGVALAHGDEGRCARVRTGQGKVVCAQPVADGLAELTL